MKTAPVLLRGRNGRPEGQSTSESPPLGIEELVLQGQRQHFLASNFRSWCTPSGCPEVAAESLGRGKFGPHLAFEVGQEGVGGWLSSFLGNSGPQTTASPFSTCSSDVPPSPGPARPRNHSTQAPPHQWHPSGSSPAPNSFSSSTCPLWPVAHCSQSWGGELLSRRSREPARSNETKMDSGPRLAL